MHLGGPASQPPMSDDDRPDITTPERAAGKPRLKRLRLLAILSAVLLLGLRLVRVRDVRLDRLRPAVADALLAAQGRPELGAARRPRPPARRAQPAEPRDRDAVADPADRQGGGDLDRGQALRDQQRHRHPRHRARVHRRTSRHKGNVQGASTIEQQFIKNALQAQSHRTIFEKLREAALAYQLSHKWSKEKIITAYLNTIYFGNGAYGIESAAQTYFGHDVNHLGCGTPGHQLCVEQLQPWEAALLAGIIQSPTAYDPANHPLAARMRRNLVLRQMLEQGYITQPDLRRKRQAGAAGAEARSRRRRSRPSKASTPATSRAGCSSR